MKFFLSKISPYNYCKISPYNYLTIIVRSHLTFVVRSHLTFVVRFYLTIVRSHLIIIKVLQCWKIAQLDWLMQGWSCVSYLCTIVIGHSDIIVVIVFLKPSQWSYYMSHTRIAIVQNLLNSRDLVIHLVILIDLVDLVNLVYLATWVIWINLMDLVNLVNLLYQEIWW